MGPAASFLAQRSALIMSLTPVDAEASSVASASPEQPASRRALADARVSAVRAFRVNRVSRVMVTFHAMPGAGERVREGWSRRARWGRGCSERVSGTLTTNVFPM